MSHHLAEEARQASAHTRAVLFSLQGDAENDQQLELPSYSNHVYDRVANAGMLASSSGTTAASWSSRLNSPSTTPPASRPGSRPGSPVLGMRSLPDALPADGLPVPERPRLNWADSELLMSIGASLPDAHQGSPHRTPPESRSGSRLGFRRSMSRPNSRPSSPEREHRPAGPVSEMPPYAAAEEQGGRRSSLFNIPHFKPLTSIGGGHGGHKHHPKGLHSLSSMTPDRPSAGDASSAGGSAPHSASHTNSNSASSSAIHSPATSNGPSRNPSFDDMTALSQVPSYQVASRGFLGGGVVPLSATVGLPDYDESEQQVQRTQSEGNLLAMGRRASQSAGSGGGTNGAGLNMTDLANGLAGLTTSASSSALASAVSTNAEPGTLAVDVPAPTPPRADGFDNQSEDEDDEDDYLEIGRSARVSRSPSVATVKPGRHGFAMSSAN